MTLAYTAAVVRTAGIALRYEDVSLDGPHVDEVVIRVAACGLCHSDIHFMEGTSGTDFPYMVGHELAGTVDQIGPGVTDLAPGDFVVVALMVPCGRCKQCRGGRPTSCAFKLRSARPATLSDGRTARRVLGVGGLADLVVVPSDQAVKIDSRVPPQVAALLGCGIPTGFGAAVHTGRAAAQDDVVVLGCGGVGIAAVAGAAYAGAARIVAIDTNPNKLPMAELFGATQTIDASTTDPVAAVLAATDGAGADLVIDAVGGSRTFESALAMRAPGGTFVVAGAPRMGDVARLALRSFFVTGGRIEVSIWGDCVAARDLPLLADLYLQGRLPLDRLVSETVHRDEAQAAYDRLATGQTLRSVVLL